MHDMHDMHDKARQTMTQPSLAAPEPPEPHAERLDLLARLADAATNQQAGVIGSLVGADLNVNLVRLASDEYLDAHINTEVDVLLVGVAGAAMEKEPRWHARELTGFWASVRMRC